MIELFTVRRDLGCWAGVMVGAGSDLSDVGGEGGVCVSEFIEDVDFVGGVAIVGEEAVVAGECSETED